jgi:phosphatidate cytidylyltransferase
MINADHLPVTLWREMIFAIIGAFGLYVILQLISRKKFNMKSFGRLCLALLLITLPGMFAICIGLISPRLLLGMFILLWSSDVFAYFGGKAFGRHKLMPSVSPKKTWEGVFSGLIMVSVAAWGMSYLFPEIALRHWISIGMLVVVFGTIGDLMQSAVKRAAGVKDSGNILPGHGGFWDRFDSFLGSAPWVGAYLMLFYEQT